jgi:glycosyltransferase involved in cell wall biosynthesis
VGGVGRQVAEKGIRELGVAASTLSDEARFVWVGPADPDKPDALDNEIPGLDRIGGRRDMPAVYNGFDIFVLPSYREGFSRSGMEAAATGLPLVLSDIRGCREVGRNGEEALLVPPGDAHALTQAVRRLIDDPDLRARLGAAARARALAEFDQVRVAAISLETYAAVARRKRLGWTSTSVPWESLAGVRDG